MTQRRHRARRRGLELFRGTGWEHMIFFVDPGWSLMDWRTGHPHCCKPVRIWSTRINPVSWPALKRLVLAEPFLGNLAHEHVHDRACLGVAWWWVSLLWKGHNSALDQETHKYVHKCTVCCSLLVWCEIHIPIVLSFFNSNYYFWCRRSQFVRFVMLLVMFPSMLVLMFYPLSRDSWFCIPIFVIPSLLLTSSSLPVQDAWYHPYCWFDRLEPHHVCF